MKLENIYNNSVVTVEPTMQAIEAAKLMTRKNISSLLITEDGKAVGIVTERDFIHLFAHKKNLEEVQIKEIMSSPVITSELDSSIEEVLDLMDANGIRRIPVTKDGKVAGIVTQTDITNAIRQSHIVIEPVVEDEIIPHPLEHKLEIGRTYIFPESKPVKSLEAFAELVQQGIPGLILTRENPDTIRQIHGLEKTPIVWLTNVYSEEFDKTGVTHSLNPQNLMGISMTVGEFMLKAEKSVILIDGLIYLITQNKFDKVLNLIQNIRDKSLRSQATLILTLNPKALENQQLELIHHEVDEIRKGHNH